jgi:hypothetical protein
MRRLAVVCVIVAAAFLALGGFRVFHNQSPTLDDPLQTERKGDAFAQDRNSTPPSTVPFDGKQAMGYLDAICKIGPRISGTDGMTKQQQLVQKHFEALGAKVEFQRFTARQESQPQAVEMANMIISWHPDRPRRVILCSHYDTRPIADQEEDRTKWHQPFVSANDGGSGVALLMELGNHMKDLKTQVGVDFVLFDGEEYIFEHTDKYFFGSEHFGLEYRRNKGKIRYFAAVLLDMIAGKNARFAAEGTSWSKAPQLVREIWTIAQESRSNAFVNRVGGSVSDDHVSLNAAGIPAVDIIPETRNDPVFGFTYPHWHRLSDVPGNCSGESMAEVARVLAAWLMQVR